MITAPSLIPELDDIVRRGDPKRRADAALRVGELFLQGASSFHPDHVNLFDGVLTSLVPHAELAARIELAERLSVIENAPPFAVACRTAGSENAPLTRWPVAVEDGSATVSAALPAVEITPADACVP